jgi:guanylate kinase
MDQEFGLARPAFPVVVSGPSGVGKTVLCRRLCESLPRMVRSISATTRPPRGDERDGESYFFWSEDRFRAEIDRGGLAEWAEVHGRLYGTPRSWLDERLAAGESAVLNIDVQGGLQVRTVYPSALLVFLLPPSWAALEARLRGRGTDAEEEIQRRLCNAEKEIRVLPLSDAVIVNDRLDEAAVDLVSVVRAERARTPRLIGPGWEPPPRKGT